jgi:hypothetical protein
VTVDDVTMDDLTMERVTRCFFLPQLAVTPPAAAPLPRSG